LDCIALHWIDSIELDWVLSTMNKPQSLERNLCVIKKVFVFRIPPSTSAMGYRAADWPQQPIWTGRLRVFSKDERLTILLEHTDQDGCYAVCPVTSNKVVEPVTDSSRYFVLRLDDGKGHHAFIGLGFQNRYGLVLVRFISLRVEHRREEAFDFKVALQDFENEQYLPESAKEMLDATPAADLSLPDGATITVNIGNKAKKKPTSQASANDKGSLTLAPPQKVASKPRSSSSAAPASRGSSASAKARPSGPGGSALRTADLLSLGDLGSSGAVSSKPADDFDVFFGASSASGADKSPPIASRSPARPQPAPQQPASSPSDWVSF